MRINVSEENSTEVIWYKERFLSDNEIVEHHNPSNTIYWSIHRPKRGWYIRLRHPSFPPGTFIPFLPVPPLSPYYAEAALSFNSRTNAGNTPSCISASSPQFNVANHLAILKTLLLPLPAKQQVRTATHPHPPQASRCNAICRSFIDIDITHDNSSLHASAYANHPIHPCSALGSTSNPNHRVIILFSSRALSVIKRNRPSHSKSFTLSRIPVSPHSPPPPYASQASIPESVDVEEATPRPPLVPFLVHHHRTPVFTIGSFTGLIEITDWEERMMGVDRSFGK